MTQYVLELGPVSAPIRKWEPWFGIDGQTSDSKVRQDVNLSSWNQILTQVLDVCSQIPNGATIFNPVSVDDETGELASWVL